MNVIIEYICTFDEFEVLFEIFSSFFYFQLVYKENKKSKSKFKNYYLKLKSFK